MRRRTFVATAGMLAASLAVRGWPQGSPRRVSFISSSTPEAYAHLLKAFRDELRARGYAEGRDIVLDLWWADDRVERVPALISEAMATQPAVIVTHGSASVAALQKATRTVPIVFASAGDPVGLGFVASFRRPGGNITGVVFNQDTNQKLYELAKIVLPRARRVATLLNMSIPVAKEHAASLPATTKALGLEALILDVRSAESLEPAFAKAGKAPVQAVIVSAMAPFVGLRSQIVELQFKHRMPTFHATREAVEAGGLASYGFPYEENYRRAAALVDEILKGRSPAEIPVEIPTKYETAINVGSAHRLGIKVPESALLRADKLIGA